MKNKAMHSERETYLLSIKRRNYFIKITQIGFLLFLIGLWEFLAQIGVIDSFITSQPSRVVKTIINLSTNDLLMHLGVTCAETIIGFVLGVLLGMFVASILWWFQTFSDIFEPYLVILNSLPKIALGPIIIIWVGAGMKAIVVMALAISLIVTVMELLNGFNCTNQDMIKMAKTFGASKLQIFTKIILPSNIPTLVNSLKINLGLSLVGVIAGEFLVSKAGLGYLIVYGGQVFKLDLVMASVIILAVFAAIIYKFVLIFEKIVLKNRR
jgi:NitT/TauT family transport system permease protein